MTWWFGWPVLAALVGVTVGVVAVWGVVHRPSFSHVVGLRVLASWRWLWVYRRHWQPVMVVAGLAERYHDRDYLPRIRRVSCTRWVDRVEVRLVTGQAPRQWEDRAVELAHGFGALSCRVKVTGPRRVVLELPRGDSRADATS